MKFYATDYRGKFDLVDTLANYFFISMLIGLLVVAPALFYLDCQAPVKSVLLTEVDGCKVFKVYGHGNPSVYVTTCEGRTEWTTYENKRNVHHEVQTHR